MIALVLMGFALLLAVLAVGILMLIVIRRLDTIIVQLGELGGCIGSFERMIWEKLNER